MMMMMMTTMMMKTEKPGLYAAKNRFFGFGTTDWKP